MAYDARTVVEIWDEIVHEMNRTTARGDIRGYLEAAEELDRYWDFLSSA